MKAADVMASKVGEFTTLMIEETGATAAEASRALLAAGALEPLGPSRREALWQTRGFARTRRTQMPFTGGDAAPAFEALDGLETIAWDYASTHHSTRGHPLEPLRETLVLDALVTGVERTADRQREHLVVRIGASGVGRLITQQHLAALVSNHHAIGHCIQGRLQPIATSL